MPEPAPIKAEVNYQPAIPQSVRKAIYFGGMIYAVITILVTGVFDNDTLDTVLENVTNAFIFLTGVTAVSNLGKKEIL